jgi:3-oxoacyl-[acyl-carrier-protein] synthase-3
MHHVSRSTFDAVAVSMGAPPTRFYQVIAQYGNIASASVPFAISRAAEDGTLRRGEKIMLIGLAAGISMSVQLMIW